MNSERTPERTGESTANNVAQSEPIPTVAPKPQGSTQNYDSQFAILQALQKGEITVAEAEALLRSL